MTDAVTSGLFAAAPARFSRSYRVNETASCIFFGFLKPKITQVRKSPNLVLKHELTNLYRELVQVNLIALAGTFRSQSRRPYLKLLLLGYIFRSAAVSCLEVAAGPFSQLLSVFLALPTDDLTGAALIPASPDAWTPYPLYTTELTPGLPHAAFTYPAAAAAAAALHAQVREQPVCVPLLSSSPPHSCSHTHARTHAHA